MQVFDGVFRRKRKLNFSGCNLIELLEDLNANNTGLVSNLFSDDLPGDIPLSILARCGANGIDKDVCVPERLYLS